MVKEQIAVFPASGVANGIIGLEQHIGKQIIRRFPKGFINSYHIEDRASMKEAFVDTRQNIFGTKQYTGQYNQQKKPRITITFNNLSESQEDAAGGIESPFTYPLVQGVHPEKHGYLYAYLDKTGTSIMFSSKRIRVNFDVIIEVESIADQETMLNEVENLFKVQYGTIISAKTSYLLPNAMIDMLVKCKYHQNLVDISATTDETAKKKLIDEMNTAIRKDLYTYSNCNGIKEYARENNCNSNFFKMDMYYNQIYIQLNGRPEKTDGDRLGSIFSRYTVTFSGFFEFRKPVAYILYLPEYINGYNVVDCVGYNTDTYILTDHNYPGMLKAYKRRENIHNIIKRCIKQEGFEIVYKESGVTFEDKKDTFNLIEWMETSTKKDDLKWIIQCMKDIEPSEFNTYFRFFLVNSDEETIIADKDVSWDGENITVTNISSTLNYRIYLLTNFKKIINLLIQEGYSADDITATTTSTEDTTTETTETETTSEDEGGSTDEENS